MRVLILSSVEVNVASDEVEEGYDHGNDVWKIVFQELYR